MPITDPRAVTFSNDYVRPVAEALRDLNAAMRDMDKRWNDGTIAGIFTGANLTLKLRDGGRGRSVLTGADVTNLQSQVQGLIALFDGPGVLDVIQKPVVRPLILRLNL